MRGNRILLTQDRAFRVEGYVESGQTFKPGQIVQYDYTLPLISGRPQAKVYTPGSDGAKPVGPYIVVEEDIHKGDAAIGATYAAGEHFFGCIPIMGCELNLLLQDYGTGTHARISAGDQLEVQSGKGTVQTVTGSPASIVAVAAETIPAPTSDSLVWAQWA
jgi:hypothetical protein